jgi:hypothetical protein
MDTNQEIPLTLTAGDASILLQLLNEAPYRVAAPLIDKMRRQILAVDPTAFDPVVGQAQPNGHLQEIPR